VNAAGRSFHSEVRKLRMQRVQYESARKFTHIKSGMLSKGCMMDISLHSVFTEVDVFCPHCQATQSEMIRIHAFGGGCTFNIILSVVVSENQLIEIDNPG
jgi:hypothetical protein